MKVRNNMITFFNTIRGRLLILTVMMVAVFILIFAYFYIVLRKSLIENAEKFLENEIEYAASVMEKNNLEAVTAAMFMAMAQKNGLFGKFEESLSFAREILEKYPDFTGSYFGYEPDPDYIFKKENLGDIHSRNFTDGKGRFIPYWFRDNGEIRLSPLIDMESSLYYAGCLERYSESGTEQYCITEPYLYEGKMIVEQVFPVIIKGRFMGVAGVDRTLQSLSEYSVRDRHYDSTAVMLISSMGRILYSDIDLASEKTFADAVSERSSDEKDKLDRRMMTFNIEKTDYSEILNIFYRKDPEHHRPVRFVDPLCGLRKHHYYTASEIPTGNWTIVMRVSEDEILYPVYSFLFKTFLFSFSLFLIYYFFSVRLGKQITDPINSIIKNAGEIQKGNFSFEKTRSAISEISRMSASLLESAESRAYDLENLEAAKKNLQKEINRQYRLLEKSEARYKSLFDNTDNSIMILQNGTIMECNRKSLEMYRCESDYLIGKTTSDISPEFQSGGKKSSDLAAEIIDKSLNGEPQYFEWLFTRKDRTVFEAEISLSRLYMSEEGYLISMVWDITKKKQFEKERESRIEELKEALESIKTLKGLLPICSHCKKIRDDAGYWNRIEQYIEKHTDASFTHGLCPDCMKELYGDELDDGK